MKEMTLRRIAQCCGGILHVPKEEDAAAWRENSDGRCASGNSRESHASVGGQASENAYEDALLSPADREVTMITTDSRQAIAGSLFAAIPGQRVDGHRFIPQVFSQGAIGVISEQELQEAGGCWIKVKSTIEALGMIAAEYLSVLGLPVVGISGSVGKTSTKEMIASVLSVKYRTLKTEGNFNNELGVPLTIFRLRPEDEIAVIEMGISHFGEMHGLARITRPETAVITNIGQCHLEYLGDRDGVLRAKTEMFDYIRPQGHVILNGNDDKLSSIYQVGGITPLFYGMSADQAVSSQQALRHQAVAQETGQVLTVWAEHVVPHGLSGSDCEIHIGSESFAVHVPLPGQHMVMNALAAAAVGMVYGLSAEEIRQGIELLQSVNGRLNIHQTAHYEIIDDCYNANPMSMKAALSVLKDAGGETVAIVGDMAELGADEVALHESCGEHAAHCHLKRLIGIGPLSAALITKARQTDPTLDALHFDTVESFLAEARALIPQGATVLVKASHCMGFERIEKYLEEQG